MLHATGDVVYFLYAILGGFNFLEGDMLLVM